MPPIGNTDTADIVVLGMDHEHDYSPHTGLCRECNDYNREFDGIGNYYAEKERIQREELAAFRANPANRRRTYVPSPRAWID
jgi:hypothetical protein